jgi:hypothetical protein
VPDVVLLDGSAEAPEVETDLGDRSGAATWTVGGAADVDAAG